MPRPRLPPNLVTKLAHPPTPKEAPRLWNAKRRIKGSIGLTPGQFLHIEEFPPSKWFDEYKERKESLDRKLSIAAAGETEPQSWKEGLESSEPSALSIEAAGETEPQSSKERSELSETSELNEETDEIELPPWKPLSRQDVDAIQKLRNGDGVLEWWKLDRKHLDKFMDVHPELRRVSSDVRSFIWETGLEMDQSSISTLLQNPVRFFSASANVPHETRKQIYFPDPSDAVVLMRTPHLGPRYAAFDVPRHFSKVDLRAYLKNVYNVDVLHIRSVVVQHKVERKDPTDPYTQGPLFRPPSSKKMTCQLAQPFVYPEEVESFDAWEYMDYWNSNRAMVANERNKTSFGTTHPNKKHRQSIAQQAQDLLKGRVKWAPTWQKLGDQPATGSP
ncbi:mitochondrial 54S ribosomal protein YmL41 [Elasticomyces elasticus]|uniref:Large ribosomal subunit protein uL23m n=1 Tax=Exophiala sideris TaxID=1016849 RepID=A0ABR0JI47_9EURO|nr:mitochondrial 54S ribosomal protein YmL41 [Elasticomyces elasticus]KAK5034139.1 mitochondrial 54S ribosomal protein YmL41 [Exophiala sideris]KAK5042435.1 mitochondrial 54S ribosomal protein YmL41 [Exophiala sideris]KAK5065517.1 mitochondrial 54S ribosomal protein YmL41 [Exophiala sideris]KAK5186024.1 mitochondrial 54S ribosomal protein YmL41 [Eurotiomycetes sp. CCFEE 6388]